MDELTQFTELLRRVLHTRVDLWMVIVGALALAWLDRSAAARIQRRYDAWWFKHLTRSGAKKI
jgi:hypothetical protein